MTSEVIPINMIDEPKADPKRRKIDKEFCSKLAQSIRVEGLHQPIGVRPNPDKPGRYTRIFGAHRLTACRDHLKWDAIEAKIYSDMDEASSEMAADAENLWRNPLTAAQAALALKRWFGHYQAQFPESVGKGTAGSKAAAAKRSKVAEKPGEPRPIPPRPESGLGGKTTPGDSDTPVDPATEAPAPAAPERPAPGVSRVASEVMGVSLTIAKERTRIARVFDAEQLQVFDQMKVGVTLMNEISAIKDAAVRGQIVNLIATGMDPRQAIDSSGSPPETASKPKAHEPHRAEVEMSNDDWINTYCHDLVGKLKDPTRYREDAILYRIAKEPRHALRTCKPIQLAVKSHKATRNGALFRMVIKFYKMSHPRDWLLCSDCSGTGSSGPKVCGACFGDGYKIATED